MTIHFRDEGEGRPLVLLHGLGASSRVFDPLHDALPHRRVISVDLPRTAKSGHWASSTPHDVAAGLLDFLSSRGVEAFELFGHSFGGLVALHAAAEAPARIRRLVVASAPATGVPAEFKMLLANPLMDTTMRWFGRLPPWRPAMRGYLAMIWGQARPAEHHLALYEEAVRAPGFTAGMLEALRAVSEFRLPVETLRAAPFEKLCLWGERDRLVSPVEGERLARAIGARLIVWPEVGHCVPEESPARLVEVLDQPRENQSST